MSNVTSLSENFLFELYYAAFKYNNVCSVLAQHMKPEYLPDREFQALNKGIVSYYLQYKIAPTYGNMIQRFNDNEDVKDLITDIEELSNISTLDAILDTLEEYIKNVRLQRIYTDVGKLYNQGQHEKARDLFQEYGQWVAEFTLKTNDFVDVIGTFGERYQENVNAAKELARGNKKEVSRFYIDELDELNAGRNLRTQVSCFMAPTGVGKSHIARHIGLYAAIDDGLNVLHFQLEGSRDEVVNAYSGALIQKNSFYYERGRISETEIKTFSKQLSSYAGTIRVRSFPRFNNHVSTIDVKNGIAEYRKVVGCNPDIVIIDSLDLLDDSSGRKWDSKDERHKRIATTNDLKDIAGDEDVWIVTTYQATMENRDWLNDEKNVLTEFNCSEAKGIARPMTHLVTLNQSDNERVENIMRLHVAKSRFFKKGKTIKIATRYDDEVFYDRPRTINLMKTA